MSDTSLFSTRDEELMSVALELAARGLYTASPNPRVGCVLARDGSVAGQGWHERAGEPHAEIMALRDAGDRARGATAYVTLEPCSHHGRTGPCADALLAAGVSGVVMAGLDPNPLVAGAGLARLRAGGVATRCGLMAAQARALNPGFFKRMVSGVPWVRLKSAMSLDARTALADGRSKWITGPDARRDVHRYRARSDAMLTGIGTVLADDCRLDARVVDAPLVHGPAVVLDRTLRCPTDAAVLAHPGGALLLCAPEHVDGESAAALRDAGAEVIAVRCDAHGVDLAAALALLGERSVNEVLVEAGASLTGALLAAGLVDEWVIYMAPHLLGDAARPLARLAEPAEMSARLGFEWQDVERVGDDLKLVLGARR